MNGGGLYTLNMVDMQTAMRLTDVDAATIEQLAKSRCVVRTDRASSRSAKLYHLSDIVSHAPEAVNCLDALGKAALRQHRVLLYRSIEVLNDAIREMPERAGGGVYVVRVGGRVKIGTTARLASRLRDFRRGTGAASAFELIGVYPDFGEVEESALHVLAWYHHKEGEWFDIPRGCDLGRWLVATVKPYTIPGGEYDSVQAPFSL